MASLPMQQGLHKGGNICPSVSERLEVSHSHHFLMVRIPINDVQHLLCISSLATH